jgi:hypothetical protein
MTMYAIACPPGYQISGGISAFTAKRPMAVGVNRIQRERLQGNAATTHVLGVTTDVPGPRSALSLVRRT